MAEKIADKKITKEKQTGMASRIKKIVRSKEETKEKKEKSKKAEKIVFETAVTDPFDTLKFVLMTEKAIQLIEKQNKLVFIVRRSAAKREIKNAAESAFKSPVSSVQTMIDQKNRKKAFIKFVKEGEAGEIAIKLGII